MSNKRLVLPCIKGRIGEWFYYSTIMSFQEVGNRVKLPKEIDKKFSAQDLKLGDWIQRHLDEKRTSLIVDYLKTQDERFFNSLILGIFDGKPAWQEIKVLPLKDQYSDFDEIETEYLSLSMGILTLDGSENIFAIDGQHRAIGIREAIKKKSELLKDEVPVIFVPHQKSEAGNVRTRRLFSTLNRYAKPVDKSEIIALSEDDNCAIICRALIDNLDWMKGKVLINKSPSISPNNKNSFTNIRTLYDIIERITTNKKVYSFTVKGKPNYDFTNKRETPTEILVKTNEVINIFKESLFKVPSFITFISTGEVDRTNPSTNLVFRPIGQSIFFDVIKVSIEHSKYKQAIQYFKKDSFNLSNPIWHNVLWDSDSNNITTQKTRVKYATLLIITHLGIPFHKSKKDLELFKAFNVDSLTI